MTHLIASNICWNSNIFQQYYSPSTFTPGLLKNNSQRPTQWQIW